MGALLAAMAFGTLGGLVYLQMKVREAAGGAERATVSVLVEAPEGEILYDGTLEVGNATAYTALLAAAEAAGFEVETREYPHGLYVSSVGGHEARGSSGWIYEVVREGERIRGAVAADLFPLETGDRLHWRWSEREA